MLSCCRNKIPSAIEPGNTSCRQYLLLISVAETCHTKTLPPSSMLGFCSYNATGLFGNAARDQHIEQLLMCVCWRHCHVLQCDSALSITWYCSLIFYELPLNETPIKWSIFCNPLQAPSNKSWLYYTVMHRPQKSLGHWHLVSYWISIAVKIVALSGFFMAPMHTSLNVISLIPQTLCLRHVANCFNVLHVPHSGNSFCEL